MKKGIKTKTKLTKKKSFLKFSYNLLCDGRSNGSSELINLSL